MCPQQKKILHSNSNFYRLGFKQLAGTAIHKLEDKDRKSN